MPRGKLQSTKDAEAGAPAILAEKLAAQGNIVQRERSFKTPGARSKAPVTAEERAEMMMTILEDPEITTREFGLKHGYRTDPKAKPSSSAYEMMTTLKQELAEYIVPEMEDLLKADLLILAAGAKEQFRRMKDSPDTLNMNEMTNAMDRSFRRVRLLQGKSTANTTIRVDEFDGMDEASIDAYLKDAIRIEVIDKKDRETEHKEY